MFVYYNPNPARKKNVGDCVVRAISKALGKSWEETYLELSIQGYIMGDLLSSNSVWNAYLRHKSFKREIIPDNYPESYTLADFAEDHPNGTYVIGTGTHAVCVVDGIIYDAWDSSRETPVYFYYKGD